MRARGRRAWERLSGMLLKSLSVRGSPVPK
jgi:hypothetical protein